MADPAENPQQQQQQQQRPSKIPRSCSSEEPTTTAGDEGEMITNDEGRTSGGRQQRELNFVEFYCGLGGWSMALEAAALRISCSNKEKDIKLRCVAALDHSDLCTKVYKHNHRNDDDDDDTDTSATTSTITTNIKNIKTMNIEKLTHKQMQKFCGKNNDNKKKKIIDIWAMSPPCQPHTRQHSNQDADLQDPRSNSFLHLCHLLETSSSSHSSEEEEEFLLLPSMILVENVIGFETSNSCKRFRKVLSKHKYWVGHFHLSPTQVGLPNDRPRYYCVAVREQRKIKISPTSKQEEEDGSSTTNRRRSNLQKYLQLESINDDDENSICHIQTQVDELNILPPNNSPLSSSSDNHPRDNNNKNDNNNHNNDIPAIASFLDPETNNQNNGAEELRIPEKVLNSNAAWCFDIVTPSDRRTSCFTSAYGKYVRGTGSVLYFGKVNNNQNQNNKDSDDNDNDKNNSDSASSSFHPKLLPPDQRQFDPNWSVGLDLQNEMRYFSGMEMAKLFDFRHGFQFPEGVTTKQQWKLIGNSLNVRVASRLCELGLDILLNDDDD